jgi:hypothetical protein
MRSIRKCGALATAAAAAQGRVTLLPPNLPSQPTDWPDSRASLAISTAASCFPSRS